MSETVFTPQRKPPYTPAEWRRIRRIVCQRKKNGDTLSYIADDASLPFFAVARANSELIAEGKLPRLQPGRPRADGANIADAHLRERLIEEHLRQKEDRQIVELFRQGKSDDEISTALYITKNHLDYRLRLLRKEGRIQFRPRRAPHREPISLTTPRTQIVLAMLAERRKHCDIGAAVGVTGACIQHIHQRILDDYGEDAIGPSPYLSAQELRDALKIPIGWVYDALHAGAVPFHRGAQNRLYVHESDIERLKQACAPRRGTCAICGEEFIVVNHRVTCSARCWKKYFEEKFVRVRGTKPNPRRAIPWHRELMARLDEVPARENEEWLTLTEAKRRSGLSQMRVIWLGVRTIIHTRPDPVRRNRLGKPITLYSANELDVAKEAFEKYRTAT